MMDELVSDEFVSRLPGYIIMSTLCDGAFALGTHRGGHRHLLDPFGSERPDS